MGNYCSTEDKSDSTSREEKKTTAKSNKNVKASKYAVSSPPTDGASESGDVNTNEAGFSNLGGGDSADNASQAAAAASPASPASPPSSPKAPSFAVNAALVNASSFKIVPPVENAVIKANSRDPADYEAEGLEGVVWTRVPGQINDQRINIANCKDCTFILLDQCDSIQIDDCEGCKFYIGPTAGSVFIRSSKNCNVIAACGQLRTRDLFDSKLALFCHSRPVIESSRNVGVGCYPSTHGYAQLLHHMCKSRLSQFTNLWYFVHDFTPSKKVGELNYYVVPQSELEAADFFPSIAAIMPEVLSADAAKAIFDGSAVIPYVGFGAKESNDYSAMPNTSLIIFRPGAVDAARAFVSTVEVERRKSNACMWQFLVEHQFKGAPDGSTSSALAKLGVPASDVAALGNADFIMGVYSHADGCNVPSLVPGPAKVNVLFHGPIDSAAMLSVCPKLFSDLPTQGKGFGSSH